MRHRNASLGELLDGDSFDERTLAANLADIRRINALLGWTSLAARTVVAEMERRGLRSATLLDVASGSADIPLAIARHAARRNLQIRLTITDLNPHIVRIAASRAAALAAVRVERQDALSLPYPNGSYDFGLCTLALHHFDPAHATALLAELRRVSRQILVFDVLRSRLAYAGAWLMTRALPMHPMTRHDAPVSVLRAYNADELRQLARDAGLTDATVRVAFPFRLLLTAGQNPITAAATR